LAPAANVLNLKEPGSVMWMENPLPNLIREESGTWYRGQIKLNNNCILKKIDFNITNTSVQDHKGKTSFGIYKIEDDTLTIVASKPGRHVRPLTFNEFEKAIVYIFVRG
jgi:uncharacterized protein (TIGR03067 family)